MTDPVLHPDQIAEQLRRTEDYIRTRYGDGPIPALDAPEDAPSGCCVRNLRRAACDFPACWEA